MNLEKELTRIITESKLIQDENGELHRGISESDLHWLKHAIVNQQKILNDFKKSMIYFTAGTSLGIVVLILGNFQ